ncbi:dehydrogenase [Pontibacter korlensis]|uniref:Dehydrogenase n=1 Tax=Pontibacter korlensis TaxID=400092 RepID=A0A0E3UZJ3_9BACT|nr:c-type cytochrome [Pontibacter korlensis]AKD05421.1 dehydrogenase [Pontibacter korlensis]
MKKYLHLLLLPAMACTLYCCQGSGSKNKQQVVNTPGEVTAEEAARVSLESSPVVPAEASINLMQVADGFNVELVAAEPLVNTPVAMTFDYEGRMWVVEMQGYMPDTLGTGEEVPNGKIVILEDSNSDGVADKRKVFLDSLVLPRAICLVDDGVLVAEPPSLWFYEIEDDKPGKKTLVDAAYAEGGNVEHQPNGLLRALDNWIYNAKSAKRYRKAGDRWKVEQTHFRGQWGIAQDNYGRLYYNNNSENVLGDYFTPGFGATNKNQRRVSGFNEKIVANNRVYPLRPTPGVNRGYMEGILDESLRLANFTAASSPVVYRGGLFGQEYASNVFVAEPAGNLIKRNLLDENGYVTSGAQAYEGKEFLASIDERFRPVSLYNAPDGALYVVDMYRGIIQHKTYLTTYLKKEIGRRDLTQPLGYGRIYRITPKNKEAKPVKLPANPQQLVRLLGHPNGWVRDNAQQMLLDRNYRQAIPALRQAASNTKEPLKAMHALWTLEGLGALQADEVLALLRQPAWPVRMQALSVLPSVMDSTNVKRYVPVLEQLVSSNDTLAAPYLAFLANHLQRYDQAAAQNLLQQLARTYQANDYVADALISNYQDREKALQKQITAFVADTSVAIHKRLQRVLDNIESKKVKNDTQALLKEFPKGAAVYASTCQTCHGADGNGVRSLAPPLNQSEWVTGEKAKLISIVLFGLTGPVRVNGHLYRAPEINGDMPGIGYDKSLSNEDIAQLLSFVRKSWQNDAGIIHPEEVGQVRLRLKDRQEAFTVEELNKL